MTSSWRMCGFPAENLIGEENKGWTYAKFLLGNERTSMAGIGRSMRYLDRLKQIVKAEIPKDDPAYLDFISDIARIELDVLALEATELRVVAQMARGIEPGPVASLFKIRGTEIFQNITELTHRAIGNYGLAIREHPAERQPFHAGPRLRSYRFREISELPQAQHLRRIERNPAQHHRQSSAGSVTGTKGRSDGYPIDGRAGTASISVQRLLRDHMISMRAARSSRAKRVQPQAMGRVLPSSALRARRFPKSTAGSAVARWGP